MFASLEDPQVAQGLGSAAGFMGPLAGMIGGAAASIGMLFFLNKAGIL